MKDILLNISDKALLNEYVDNADRVKQQVIVILNIWKREWLLDETLGVDYLSNLRNKSLMLADVSNAITTVSGVTKINSIDITEGENASGQKEFTINAVITIDSELVNINEVIV